MTEDLAVFASKADPFFERREGDVWVRVWLLSNNRHLIWCKVGEVVSIGRLRDIPQRALASCFGEDLLGQLGGMEKEILVGEVSC